MRLLLLLNQKRLLIINIIKNDFLILKLRRGYENVDFHTQKWRLI